MQAHLTVRRHGELLIHDPSLLPTLDSEMFDPAALADQGRVVGHSSGRRTAYFVRFEPHTFVLRHYWRGGLAARLSPDRYLWLGEGRTRAVREWALLRRLGDFGLPVPRAAALRVRRRGLSYQADLLTLLIPDTRSLASYLRAEALHLQGWRALGACLRRFHEAGAYHADLNAHNILIDSAGREHLIDWDRGRLLAPARRWQRANIDRLFRSLDKLAGLGGPFHYGEPERAALLAGYAG